MDRGGLGIVHDDDPRDFGARLVTAICTHPDLTAHTPIPALAPGEFEALAAAAPLMSGAEYLSAALLEALWAETDTAFRTELAASNASVQAFLRQSTIVAPRIFLDVWFQLLVGSALAACAPVSLVRGGRKRHSFIAVDDVAEFAARVADHPDAPSKRLVLGGPQALSWSDIVEKTAMILGEPVPVRSIEPGQPIPTLPPPLDAVAGGLAGSGADVAAGRRDDGASRQPRQLKMSLMLLAVSFAMLSIPSCAPLAAAGRLGRPSMCHADLSIRSPAAS